MNAVTLSIVIPCYNEEKNIPLILERFNNVMTQNTLEVILVDNGSTDGSAQVISELLPKYEFARSVRVPVNQGYGFGILSGLKEAKGDFIGWTHADMQADPNDVMKAFILIKEQNGMPNLYVKGSRKGRKFFDNFFTIGMSLFESLYLKTGLWEINAQPNIFHRSFFETWENPPYDFALDLYVYYQAKKQKLNIIRLPVLFPDRIHGVSSWNTSFGQKIKFIRRTLDFSRKLKHKLNQME